MSYPLSPGTKHDGQSTFIQNIYPFNPALSIYQPNDNVCQLNCVRDNNRSEWVHIYPNTSMTPIDKGQQSSITQHQQLIQMPIAFTPTNASSLSSPTSSSTSPLSLSTANGTPINRPEVMNWNLFSDTGYLENTLQPIQPYNIATTTHAIANAIYDTFPPTQQQQAPLYGLAQQVVSTGAATMPGLCNIVNEVVNPIGEPPSSMVSSCLSSKVQEIGYISDGDRKPSISFTNISKSRLMNRKKQLEDEKGHSSLLNWVSDDLKSNVAQQDDDDEKESDGHLCRWTNCCITTSSLEELIMHIRETHIGGGKPAYHCEWIGCARNNKPFMKRHKMHNHLRTHTGERPFVCTFADCDKRFSRPDSLNTHIRTHSNIRPYLCSVEGCDKAYFHSRSLRKHVKGHEAAGIRVPRPTSRTLAKKKHLACPSPQQHPSLSSPTSITSSSTALHSPTSTTVPLVLPSHAHFIPPYTWDPSSTDAPHDYTLSPPLVVSSSVSSHFYAPTFSGSPIMAATKISNEYGSILPPPPPPPSSSSSSSSIYPGYYYYHPSSLL